jgi:hypothetical protein
LPAEKNVHPSDLEFEEYARYVDYALGKQGYQKASSADEAGLVIYLTYGIGNPEKNEYTITLPIYGQTGVSSSTTTGTINSYGNWGTYTGTTTYTPSYGVTGYQNVQGSYVTYFRYMSLSAVDLQQYRKSQEIVELWKVKVSSTGSSGDLRTVFPAMVAASEKYLGRNTGKAISITILESDSEISAVRAANMN